MAQEEKRSRCSNPDCQVAATGTCSEGHAPPESCPNFGAAGDDDLGVYEDVADDTSAYSAGSEGPQVSLPSGEALNLAGVEEFLRWRPATFVAIVGDKDSGKSTLVCALYDRLLRGPFASLGFAGSRTLVALERRAHYSRVDSGRSVPDTPRTSISEGLHYFHLALAPEAERSARVDLFLSDRAGEMYHKARSNSSMVAALSEVPQADTLVLLLDGRRASDALERASAVQSVRQTLRAFLDNGALGETSIVQVVTTKKDVIAKSQDAAEIEDALRLFEERLLSDFGSKLRELTFSRIAARDPDGVFAPAHGLDDLLADWVASRPRRVSRSFPSSILQSEFDRLLTRTPMGEGS